MAFLTFNYRWDILGRSDVSVFYNGKHRCLRIFPLQSNQQLQCGCRFAIEIYNEKTAISVSERITTVGHSRRDRSHRKAE